MALIQLIDYVAKQIEESPSILHAKAHDVAGRPYPTRTIFIKIQQYIERHLARTHEADGRWVVVPGLRGVGKSTLLAQVYLKFLKNRKDIEFIYFSLDEVVESFGSNLKSALEAFESLKGINLATFEKPLFIFLDEVHYDENWSAIIKVLYDKNPNIFIFATGSCAVALQRNADEQRRLTVERLYPMSFAEYMIVKHKVYPPKDLKRRLTDAIFLQKDATTVYARLKGLEPEVDGYWRKVTPGILATYFRVGSIPFATTFEDQKKAFDAIYQTIRAIVESDLPMFGNFRSQTSAHTIQILSLLAISSGVSTRKLASLLGIRHETVADILSALVRAELVVEVAPYGSVKTKISKPKKYLFMSPALRASILFTIGGDKFIEQHKGDLFEDVVGMYLYKEFSAKHRGVVSYFEKTQAVHADFVISVESRDIPLEVGMGEKDTRQMWDIMTELESPYGLICHAGKLEIVQDRVIKIPHKFLLLT
ncbi:MAG: AAA family ATPase [Candidatus Gracilibacteria bacterium]